MLRDDEVRWGFVHFASSRSSPRCGDNIEPPPDPDRSSSSSSRRSRLRCRPPATRSTSRARCTRTTSRRWSPRTSRVVDEAKVARISGIVQARKVGMIEVSCSLPERGIVDPTPAIVEIVAGPAANVVTTVTPNPVIAGNDVTATARLRRLRQPDRRRRRSTDARALARSTREHGHRPLRDDDPLAVTTSRRASCPARRATTPASMWCRTCPRRSCSRVARPAGLRDQRHRPDHPRDQRPLRQRDLRRDGLRLELQRSPASARRRRSATRRIKYGGEGKYRITVTVNPPTDMNVTVSASIDVLVNSRGPAIACANDAHDAQPHAGLDDDRHRQRERRQRRRLAHRQRRQRHHRRARHFSARDHDALRHELRRRHGDRLVRRADDEGLHVPRSRTATPRRPTGRRHVSLKLTQPAVDDSTATTAQLVRRLLHTIVNSQGLRDTVHNALLAANPLKPEL